MVKKMNILQTGLSVEGAIRAAGAWYNEDCRSLLLLLLLTMYTDLSDAVMRTMQGNFTES